MFHQKQVSLILTLCTLIYMLHCVNAIPLRNAKRQPSFADHHNDLLQLNPLEDVVDPATDTGGDQSMEVFAQELRKTIMDAKTKQAAALRDDDDESDDAGESSTQKDKEITYEEETEKEVVDEDDDLPVVVQGLEKMVGVDI